jgi:hypothetical protein
MSNSSRHFDLRRILDSLRTHDSKDIIWAEKIPRRSWARLAVEGDDTLVLFPRVEGPRPADTNREQFSVRYNVMCSLQEEGRSRDDEFVILRLHNADSELVDTFLDILAILLDHMRKFEPLRLAQIVESLVELFRDVPDAGFDQVKGLFGELLVLSLSTDPNAAGEAWHTTPDDRYDFASGSCRVEVKTTTGLRQHTFAYEQLRPITGLTIIVASVVLEVDDSGESVGELLNRVVSRISNPAIANRVIRQAVSTLGRHWTNGSKYRFHTESAEQNIRFFADTNIPCILPPPSGISEVRFKVDFQLLSDSSRSDLARMGDLFEVVLGGNAIRNPASD